MKKTKLLAALAVAAVLAVGGGVLAGCKPTGGDDSGKGHTHNYTQWTKVDENTHRGTCDAKGDCDAKTKTEEHVYDGDNDTTCNKCDHVREVEAPAKVYTVTLAKGEGELPAGTETTLKTVNGKVTLPKATISKAHWRFVGWYTEGGDEVKSTTVLTQDTTLYAKYVRDNGLWAGETFVNELVPNTGATGKTQYWLGIGKRIELAKDSEVSIYMDGELVKFWISGSCVDTSKASTEAISVAKVTTDASFVIYLNDNSSESKPNDWSCEFLGVPLLSYDTTDELPAGCKGVEVNTIDGKKITLYFVNPDGEAISGDNAHKYQLYAWDGVPVEGDDKTEPFGAWATNPTMNEEITAVCGIVKTTSWKLHWDGGESSAFSSLEAGKAYVIKLKVKDGGDCEVKEYTGEADILTPYEKPEEKPEFEQGGYYIVGGFANGNFVLHKDNYIDPQNGLEITLNADTIFKIALCDYEANYEDGKHIDWSVNPKCEMAEGSEEGYLTLPKDGNNGKALAGGKYTITIVGEGEDMKFVFTPDASVKPAEKPDENTVDTREFFMRGSGKSPNLDSWNASAKTKLTKAEDKNEYTIKLDLFVGDTFKIGTADWSSEFAFGNIESEFEGVACFEDSSGNIKCIKDGKYTFTVTTKHVDGTPDSVTWTRDGDVEETPAEPIAMHYFIKGNKVTDWKIDTAEKYELKDQGDGTYKLEIYMAAGDKFGFASCAEFEKGGIVAEQVDWFGKGVVAITAADNCVTEDGDLTTDKAGMYTMILNPTAKTVTFSYREATAEEVPQGPVQVGVRYFIKGANVTGWNISTNEKHELKAKGDGTFELEIYLIAGDQFGFLSCPVYEDGSVAAKQDTWYGKGVVTMTAVNNCVTEGEGNFEAGEAGMYTITLNPETKTISFSYRAATPAEVPEEA